MASGSVADVAVDPAFWALVLTQLPALVGFFLALQRGYLVVGSTFDRERAFWEERYTLEATERKAAEARLDAFRDTMKENLEVLERSVELNERLAARR
jgi:hypothetical protein